MSKREKEKQAKLYRAENRKRSASILGVLMQRTAQPRTLDQIETALVDLLADARHFCDSRGLDYASVDKAGYLHYAAEVGCARSLQRDFRAHRNAHSGRDRGKRVQ